MYKIKQKFDGSIERYKDGLVIRGDTQQTGVDYFGTFSPVIKFTTIKCLLVLAAKHSWPTNQLDVNNVFLHVHLFEEVYMKIPLGITVYSSSFCSLLVCKLKKSLYGLKHALRQWFAKFSNALTSIGYSSSLNDYSLFSKVTLSSIILIIVYVDGILLVGNDISELESVKYFLDNQFKIKDLGFVHYFLGL